MYILPSSMDCLPPSPIRMMVFGSGGLRELDMRVVSSWWDGGPYQKRLRRSCFFSLHSLRVRTQSEEGHLQTVLLTRTQPYWHPDLRGPVFRTMRNTFLHGPPRLWLICYSSLHWLRHQCRHIKQLQLWDFLASAQQRPELDINQGDSTD